MEHTLFQRLNTEGKAQLPVLLCPITTMAVAGDTDRNEMTFFCSSGVPPLDSPWINPASSLVRKEGSWSEISLVTITDAVAQRQLKQRNLFYPHPIWYYATLAYNNTFLEVLVKSDDFTNKHYDRGALENKKAQKPAVNETLETTIFLLFKRNKEPHECQE